MPLRHAKSGVPPGILSRALPGDERVNESSTCRQSTDYAASVSSISAVRNSSSRGRYGMPSLAVTQPAQRAYRVSPARRAAARGPRDPGIAPPIRAGTPREIFRLSIPTCDLRGTLCSASAMASARSTSPVCAASLTRTSSRSRISRQASGVGVDSSGFTDLKREQTPISDACLSAVLFQQRVVRMTTSPTSRNRGAVTSPVSRTALGAWR